MASFSRRGFLGSALASVALPTAVMGAGRHAVQAGRRAQRLRVQFTPGGHTSPLQMYAMFEDP